MIGFFKKHAENINDSEFIDYINTQRNLQIDDIIPYEVGYYRWNPADKKNYKIQPFFDKSVFLPIFDDLLTPVGFELRSIKEKNHFKYFVPNARYHFYGLNKRSLQSIWETETVFLTEGTFDAMTLGIWKPNVLSLMTNKVSQSQKLFLKRYVTDIFLCLDWDKGGIREEKFIIEDLQNYGFNVKKFPYIRGIDNAKDANQFLKQSGREKFLRQINVRFKEM
jgi:DNA primase